DATLQNKTTAVKVSGITTATALAAGGSNSIAIVAPLVTLSSTAVNFSDQEVGTTSSATTITVSNAGPGPLKTSPPVLSDDQQFTISDGCSAAEIQPSSTCSFSFTFTPGNTGLRQATLTFADNSVERTHTITLKGRGTVASGALHVTVDESAVPAGPASVPNSALSYQATAPKIGVGDLPLNNLGIGDIGLNNLGIGDLPLNNLGIGDLPLNNLGVGDLPLNNLGIGDIGLNNLGIGDLPLNNLGIGPIPLTGLPLRADRVPGGWASVLANTQFDPSIRLLQDLTAADVFGANPLPGTVANIKVGDIDWANSLLHDLSPMAIVLGSTPAAAVKDPAINWCTEFANAGEQDCSLAEKIDLVVFQLSRASLPRALSAVKLGNIDMDGSVTFPSGTRTVAPAPLWTFKLSGLDMNTTDFGAIKVVNASSVVDCAGNALCSAGSTATLNDAARAGKIKPAATIGDLGPAIANFTLAEATFALLPGVFLGPVPASQAGVLTYPGTPTTAKLHYHLLVTTTGVTTTAPQATIVFPPSVRIVPGTSVTHLNSGTGSSASDPVVTLTSDGMTATWSTLPTIPANGTLTLDVAVFPGQVVGPLAVQRASVTSASSFSASLTTPADLASANTEVTDGYFEANNTVPASCPSSTKVQLTPGRVYYTHLSHRDDVEFFCFAAPPAGAIGKVDVVPTDIDVDAALLYSKDTPRDAPLRTPKTTASPVSSLGDQAASLRRGDSISSDNVDMPLPVGYAVADVSNQRGLASENLAAVSPGGTGFFIVEVTSHGGAISRNPIALSLTITPLVAAPAPTARTYASDTTPYSGSDESSTTGVLPASIPSDTKSLILVNRDGLNDDYGAASTSAFITKLNNLVTFLGAGNRTVIVPIDGDAAVRSAMQAADAAPGDIALNNAVVRKTNDVVDRLVAASGAHLQNIVLAGGSQQIRYPLCRDFTVQANERSFAGQLLVGGKTNALSAALSAGFRPCDDAYFDMNPEPTAVGWRYVPTIAGSRLLENLVEMGNQVDKFIAKGGVIDLGSTAKALAVGTDFMTDLAADTDTSNGQAFSNHALLNGSAWSDADLQSALDGTRVASINTHFDPSRALAPASGSKLFTVSTLNQMTLPELAITSSIGCHAGLSTSD
ncbi:MAG: trimeric autotransporter adhesin, partial [Mycobacterium sp.]|nr:trimeric autotransporter adhesin [Mycobacterium sp.]